MNVTFCVPFERSVYHVRLLSVPPPRCMSLLIDSTLDTTPVVVQYSLGEGTGFVEDGPG